MPEPRRPIELTLERTVIPAGATTPLTVRVATTWDPAASGADAGASLASEMARLGEQLDAAVALVAPDAVRKRLDRPVAELVEAYHPRQPELVDLLRDEGELTPGEHAALRAHLERGTPGPTAPPAGVPIRDRPIAAAPLEGDRSPETPRAVEALLREFQITSLKQAGAVRARRQISFEEYMSLKRHFGAVAPA